MQKNTFNTKVNLFKKIIMNKTNEIIFKQNEDLYKLTNDEISLYQGNAIGIVYQNALYILKIKS